MSTAISMPSPHGSFGTMYHGLPSPAGFRAVTTAALLRQQRRFDLERMRELARSDEFSDDESDGVSDEDEEDEDDDSENEDAVQAPATTTPFRTTTGRGGSRRSHASSARSSARSTPRSNRYESETDSEETVLVPFVRPFPAAFTNMHQRPQETGSPKGDDWTMIDKSPTCEGQLHGHARLTDSWF